MIDSIDAYAIVETRLLHQATLVDIKGAGFTCITWWTEASAIEAHASIQTISLLQTLELGLGLQELNSGT